MSIYKNSVDEFHRDGFVVIPMHHENEIKIISHFVTTLLYRLLKPWVHDTSNRPLRYYHLWSKEIPDEHRHAFSAKNRYFYPEPEVRNAIINDNMNAWLSAIGFSKYKIWDDGWGDVGFRLIRPGCNDGYPLCCKNWGKAKGVTSFWIPVIGHSSKETLLLAKSSHLENHPKKFIEGKFYANEPRYCGDLKNLDLIRPDLKKGEVICYHGATLHSEDVENSDITRLNLEIRLLPNVT